MISHEFLGSRLPVGSSARRMRAKRERDALQKQEEQKDDFSEEQGENKESKGDFCKAKPSHFDAGGEKRYVDKEKEKEIELEIELEEKEKRKETP